MVNLTDNHGETIWSDDGYWYKISLADGTELGLGDKRSSGPTSAANGRTLVKVVPAGQGLVFRYQRQDGDNTARRGWPIGDKGYLRGLQVEADGSEVILNLSLSWEPLKLCLYNNNDNYGIIADQLPGNRVALYASNRHGAVCGLRVTHEGIIVGHDSQHPVALDVEFVKVSTHRSKGLF